QKAFVECLEHDNIFAARYYHSAKSDHSLFANSIAYHGKRFLSDFFGRGDVVRAVEVAIVDLRSRHKTVDFEGTGALDPNFFEFVILDLKILPLSDLVPSANVLLLDGIP